VLTHSSVFPFVSKEAADPLFDPLFSTADSALAAGAPV